MNKLTAQMVTIGVETILRDTFEGYNNVSTTLCYGLYDGETFELVERLVTGKAVKCSLMHMDAQGKKGAVEVRAFSLTERGLIRWVNPDKIEPSKADLAQSQATLLKGYEIEDAMK
jgi:hypothetical protein